MGRHGAVSTTWTLEPGRFGYLSDRQLFAASRGWLSREVRRFVALLELTRCDAVFYNFGSTLYGSVSLGEPFDNERLRIRLHRRYLLLMQRLELLVLRAAGCTLLVQYQGDDARQGDFCRATFAESPAHHVTTDYYSETGDAFKRQQIRLLGTFCHKVYALNPDLLHVLPPAAQFLPYSHISLTDWSPAYASETDNTPLRIGHAPTHRGVKGTDQFLSALEVLHAEGLAFELVLVEGKTQAEAKALYATTDVVFDQLYAGWYGGLAVEVMALGKPVMVYLRDEDLQFIPPEMRADLPFIRTARHTLVDDLRALLRTPRRQLVQAGKQARAYVEKWHNPAHIAQRVLADIREVQSGPSGCQHPTRGGPVVVLANNPVVHDARVIRQAESLASFGHTVTVVCRAGGGAPAREVRHGVTYLRVEASPIREAFLPFVRLWQWPRGYRRMYFTACSLLLLAAPCILALHLASRAMRGSSAAPWRPDVRLLEAIAYPLIRSQSYMSAAYEAVLALRPSIVHANDLDTLETAVCVKQQVGCKVVYDAHELETDRSDRTGWLLRRFVRWQEGVGVANANGVVTVSAGIAGHLQAMYSIPMPTVVMNAPRAADAIDSPPGQHHEGVRKACGLSEQTPLAVFVGWVTQDRGPDVVVEALAKLPQCHLAVVGPRDPAAESLLLVKARHLGVSGRLHLLAAVPPAQVVPFIKEADLAVIPSTGPGLNYQYSLPNKLFEAVLAGLPVVVPNLQTMRSFVESREIGVTVHEHSADGFASAISQILSAVPQLRPTGERLARLKAELSWDAQAERLRELYKTWV